MFRPAISFLNGLGNGILRLCWPPAGHGEGGHHSTAELNLLVEASREAGLIREAQQEAVERIFKLSDRRVREIMTRATRSNGSISMNPQDVMLKAVRACSHAHVVVSRGGIDEVVGVLRKQDLLHQILDGREPDIEAAMQPPNVVHEGLTVLAALENFQRHPVQLAVIVDEYGSLEGLVTQTDLLEAIAGDIPEPGRTRPSSSARMVRC